MSPEVLREMEARFDYGSLENELTGLMDAKNYDKILKLIMGRVGDTHMTVSQLQGLLKDPKSRLYGILDRAGMDVSYFARELAGNRSVAIEVGIAPEDYDNATVHFMKDALLAQTGSLSQAAEFGALKAGIELDMHTVGSRAGLGVNGEGLFYKGFPFGAGISAPGMR